eukprot:6210474-Pleurochrysis_carterae.AAC.4
MAACSNAGRVSVLSSGAGPVAGAQCLVCVLVQRSIERMPCSAVGLEIHPLRSARSADGPDAAAPATPRAERRGSLQRLRRRVPAGMRWCGRGAPSRRPEQLFQLRERQRRFGGLHCLRGRGARRWRATALLAFVQCSRSAPVLLAPASRGLYFFEDLMCLGDRRFDSILSHAMSPTVRGTRAVKASTPSSSW